MWHASLESPHTGEKLGFGGLEQVQDYLRQLTAADGLTEPARDREPAREQRAMKQSRPFSVLAALVLAAVACGSTSPSAVRTPTASSGAAATETRQPLADPSTSVPTASSGAAPTEALPTAEATSTAPPVVVPTETPVPTAEPVPAVIAPETLGQLRLRWNVNYPGDFNQGSGCNPKERECTLYTNIASYAFSRDGNTLAVAVCLGTRTEDKSKPDQDDWGCTAESAIVLYDAATGEERGRLAPAVLPLSLAFHAEGTLLAAGLANSDIELWDLSSNVRSGVLSAGLKDSGLSHLAFTPDGNLLISGGSFQLQVWDWRSSALLKTIDRVIGIGLSPDSGSLVTLHLVNEPDAIRVYDLAQPDLFSVIPLAGQWAPTEFSFNPRNGWISSVEAGSNSYLANFWNPETQSVAGTLDFLRDWDSLGVQYTLNSGGFTPDGYFLLERHGKLTAPEAQPEATGLSDTLYACGFALMDIEAGQTFFSPPMLYDECTGPKYMYQLRHPATAQILSPDGRFIAADEGFGSLRLWGIDASLPAVTPECTGNCVAP